MSNSIYVIDAKGVPLLPTTPARARLLLKKEKAIVYSVIPFTNNFPVSYNKSKLLWRPGGLIYTYNSDGFGGSPRNFL